MERMCEWGNVIGEIGRRERMCDGERGSNWGEQGEGDV